MKTWTPEELALLDRFIAEAKQITITAHTHPDGDAVGSTTALLSFLRNRRGKDAVRLILPDPLPESLFFFKESFPEEIQHFSPQQESWIQSSDLIFCLDCNGFSRTESLEPFLRASRARKVLIDHHIAPERDDFDLVFSETEISSASELLYYLLRALESAPLPIDAATSLLCGMTTDTNNFANSVYPSTFVMASSLLELGVDRDRMLQHIYQSYRPNRLRILGRLLSEQMVLMPEGAAYILLSEKMQEQFSLIDGDTEGFVNMPLSIREVRLSLFLKETVHGYFRVSIRSKQGTSANALARAFFHGGGHENASGGRLFFPADIPTPEDAPAYVEHAIRQLLQK